VHIRGPAKNRRNSSDQRAISLCQTGEHLQTCALQEPGHRRSGVTCSCSCRFHYDARSSFPSRDQSALPTSLWVDNADAYPSQQRRQSLPAQSRAVTIRCRSLPDRRPQVPAGHRERAGSGCAPDTARHGRCGAREHVLHSLTQQMHIQPVNRAPTQARCNTCLSPSGTCPGHPMAAIIVGMDIEDGLQGSIPGKLSERASGSIEVIVRDTQCFKRLSFNHHRATAACNISDRTPARRRRAGSVNRLRDLRSNGPSVCNTASILQPGGPATSILGQLAVSVMASSGNS